MPPERAKKVVDRLTAPDMWTGWGIRTLTATHPAFNPYNYQTGSVWPHDNAIIAMGFKRYGFGSEAAQIVHDISKAASHFQLNQLPELYTAFQRDETTFPVQYVGRECAASLGGRVGLHAHTSDARILGGRATQQALCRSNASGVVTRLDNS